MSDHSAISIGGRALLDGFWRMVGPSLNALRAPLPTVIPGVANAMLRIRNITPSLIAKRSGVRLVPSDQSTGCGSPRNWNWRSLENSS